MTNDDIKECVTALREHQSAHSAYRSSYYAIDRYKKTDGELRALLWKHGPALIELAQTPRCVCCGATRRNHTDTWFVCECRWVLVDHRGGPCVKHSPP